MSSRILIKMVTPIGTYYVDAGPSENRNNVHWGYLQAFRMLKDKEYFSRIDDRIYTACRSLLLDKIAKKTELINSIMSLPQADTHTEVMQALGTSEQELSSLQNELSDLDQEYQHLKRVCDYLESDLLKAALAAETFLKEWGRDNYSYTVEEDMFEVPDFFDQQVQGPDTDSWYPSDLDRFLDYVDSNKSSFQFLARTIPVEGKGAKNTYTFNIEVNKDSKMVTAFFPKFNGCESGEVWVIKFIKVRFENKAIHTTNFSTSVNSIADVQEVISKGYELPFVCNNRSLNFNLSGVVLLKAMRAIGYK